VSGFTTSSTREAYRGRVRVRVDALRTPDGDVVEREVVEAHDSVVVVPLRADGAVVLVRQHRQPAGGALLELPAGTLDVAGEDALDAAARELAEETGLAAGSLEQLGRFWVSPGWSTERATVVLARDVVPTAPPDGFVAAGEEAHMDVLDLPLGEALDAVGDGRIDDATTALGLLLAERGLR